MHAIIRKGGGKYYISAVFGYFKCPPKDDSYEEYIRSHKSPYYIVWNEEKTRLVKQFQWEQDTQSIIPQVLIVSGNLDGWVFDGESRSEWVDFLPKELADTLTESGRLPEEIRQKCLAIDRAFTYREYQEVKTPGDLENLDWVSGNFHDAWIKEKKQLPDGSLYLLFDGVWGCSIEMWFRGGVECDTSSREGENDPYWLDSSVFFEDGSIYLVDDCEMTAEKITPGHCWVKARHLKYHVIPN